MAVLLTEPVLQFFDDNGNPLAGGFLYSYEAGSAFGTPKATYTNAGAGTPNSNPVELDAAGRAAVWISGSYGFILKNSAGVTIWSADNVTSFASGSVGVTVTDSGFTIQNASDLTKQFQFSLSGLTTGTTTTATVPDGNFTIATKASVDARVTLAGMTGKILNGLTLSNNTGDATNDIDIAAGACVSDDGTTIMTLSAITKRLDAGWTVGTNQGGLDTGSIADTTYFVWVIHRIDTSVTDVLFSTSASSPTMPSNYSKKKRIGAIIRASSAIRAFHQYDNRFQLDTALVSIDSQNPGTSAVTRTLNTPVGIEVLADVGVGFYPGTTRGVAYVSSLDATDQAVQGAQTASLTLPGISGGSDSWNFVRVMVKTNTSAQVRSRLSVSGANDRLGIVTYGWIDYQI